MARFTSGRGRKLRSAVHRRPGAAASTLDEYHYQAESFAGNTDGSTPSTWPEFTGKSISLAPQASGKPSYYSTNASCNARWGFNLPFGKPALSYNGDPLIALSSVFNGPFGLFVAGRNWDPVHQGVQGISSNYDITTNTGWRFEIVSGDLYFWASNGATSPQMLIGAIPDAQFTAGCVWKNGVLTGYINGVQTAQDLTSFTAAHVTSQAASPRFALMGSFGAGNGFGVYNECHYVKGVMSASDIAAKLAYFTAKFA